MKKSTFNFVSGAISISLATIVKLFCVWINNDSVFFDCLEIALSIFGLAVIVSETIRRNKAHNAKLNEIDDISDSIFEYTTKANNDTNP